MVRCQIFKYVNDGVRVGERVILCMQLSRLAVTVAAADDAVSRLKLRSARDFKLHLIKC